MCRTNTLRLPILQWSALILTPLDRIPIKDKFSISSIVLHDGLTSTPLLRRLLNQLVDAFYITLDATALQR